MIIEACVENLRGIDRAIELGANRIELCDNLAVGGTTPSLGVIEEAVRLCDSAGAQLAVMLRPRGGSFCYSDMEKRVMHRDLELMLCAGVKRAVFGALDERDRLDKAFCREIVAGGRAVREDAQFTFHMAFDHMLRRSDRLEAIQELHALGIDTILTHGRADFNPVLENVDAIKEYIAVNPSMTIMAGGGVNVENKAELLSLLPNLRALHGTRIV